MDIDKHNASEIPAIYCLQVFKKLHFQREIHTAIGFWRSSDIFLVNCGVAIMSNLWFGRRKELIAMLRRFLLIMQPINLRPREICTL